MGDNCTLKIPFSAGDTLTLVLDPANQFDANAVVLYKKDIKVGFIPKYYSKAVHDAMLGAFKISCEVKVFNTDSSCQECLQAILKIEQG